MHKTGAFRRPFLCMKFPPNTKILRPHIAFKVKLTEIENQYKLYCRTAVDGSTQVYGIDYTESYAPVSSHIRIFIIFNISASMNWKIIGLDISNSYQNNIIYDISRRQYVNPPYKYQDWFKHKWPNDSSKKYQSSDLVIQTLSTIQEKKDSGKQWYYLLTSIFKTLNIQLCASDHGVFYCKYYVDETLVTSNTVTYTSIIFLETDYMLMITQNKIFFDRLLLAFDPIFKYIIQKGNYIKFLNLCIIKSHYGLRIDKTQHIISNILDDYWKNKNKSTVPWKSSPFPTNSKFEHELFLSIPLTLEERKEHESNHNGSLEKWIVSILHIQQVKRIYLRYACMLLSMYMSNPTPMEYKELHKLM